MKRYYCICLLLLSALFTSCGKDWLDAKPVQSLRVPETKADFRAMLDASFCFTSSPNLSEIASDYRIYPESNWTNIKTSIEANAYTWSNLNSVAYERYGDWDQLYNFLLSYNIAIEGLNKLGVKEGLTIVSDLLGEAYFYRGRTFFELASMFSPPYEPGKPNTQLLGIPLRINSDMEEKPIRSTLDATYKQILADLTFALEHLSASRNILTRPSRLSAVGFLSRVYLAMEMYDEAYAYSDAYLKETDVLLDYNTLPANVMFIGTTNPEITHFNMFMGSAGISTFLVPPDWVAKYEENDLRKTVFFQPVLPNYRFKGAYTKSQSDQFSGIATDEIYLIRAECLARKGRIPEALADLNKLMRARYKKVNGQTTYVDFSTTDQTTALRKILEEREKELILRNVRWTDLRRLNRDPRFARTIIRTIGGVTYTLEPNSYKYTFPIPFNTVLSEGLQQNPGWN